MLQYWKDSHVGDESNKEALEKDMRRVWRNLDQNNFAEPVRMRIDDKIKVWIMTQTVEMLPVTWWELFLLTVVVLWFEIFIFVLSV